MALRDYQKDAVNSVTEWFKSSTLPCLVEAPTGAGKSHIIASIAYWMRQVRPDKNVLCIAPSSDLVIQNAQKYRDSGYPSSLFSSSAGEVSLRHPVVFGTPLTIANRLDKFGDIWSALIIDEAHGITPTIENIYTHLKQRNPLLRTAGFTATPYRLDTGYIYNVDQNDLLIDPDGPIKFFQKKVFTIEARHLISKGYLTPPVVGLADSEVYDRSVLEKNSAGSFTPESIDRAFVGHGRKTSKIIEDIVNKSYGRGNVIIFASTIAHAYECSASLPKELTRVITGSMPKRERQETLRLFKSGAIKYLVNVGVLTTGFDAPNIGVVAILRATESASLLTQMIGRGLRLMDGKHECLVLDYAGNIEEHFPDGDLFKPEIESTVLGRKGKVMNITCPECNHAAEYLAAPNPDMLDVDKFGYFTDLAGKHIMFGDEFEAPLPAHLGRRCVYVKPSGERCGHRWMFKLCSACGEKNDIASTSCQSCRAEIVDPNSKLDVSEYVSGGPSQSTVSLVKDMYVEKHISKAGNPCLKVTYVTERDTFETYIQHKATQSWLKAKYYEWKRATNNGDNPPYAIAYKQTESGFWEVYRYYDS